MEATLTAPTNLHTERMLRLRQELDSSGWAGLLVLDAVDISYLTGLQSTNAALFVTPDQIYVATDFRYAEKAAAIGGDVVVEQLDQGLYAELGRRLGEWTGGGGQVAYAPSSLSHKSFLQLTEGLDTNVTLRAADGVVSRLREVKDPHELDAIRRAAAMLEGAYQLVVDEGLIGRRESEVAWSIERYLREQGASGLSFPSIVASGPNGALPHHTTSPREIEPGTLVTIDIGCVVDGYCSDCTRTFSTGGLSDQLQEIYDVTLRAQEASLAAVTAGADGTAVDAIARDIIEAAGYGERFGHGLGHGVGLDIHEGPRLSRTSQSVLAAAMVVTVEPGIYLQGIGGVRIEDLVVVTDGAPEILTGFSKRLIHLEG